MTHLYPGQLVECVNDDPDGVPQPSWVNPNGGLNGLRRGNVYTVRAVVIRRGHPVVRLEEIRRPRHRRWGEQGYHPNRFRPVDDRKLDVFRAMLEPKRRREHV